MTQPVPPNVAACAVCGSTKFVFGGDRLREPQPGPGRSIVHTGCAADQEHEHRRDADPHYHRS